MISSNLVGVSFASAKKNIQDLKMGMVLTLVPYVFEKKGCETDPYAVKVLNGDAMCGHLTKEDGFNKRVVESGATQCRITEIYRRDKNGFSDSPDVPVVGVTVEIDADVASVASVAPVVEDTVKPNEKFELLKSFNEAGVVVEFYPIAHEYWIGDKRLGSVTGAKGGMYKSFDNNVANNCTSWGIPPQDIKDMWSLNGDSASSIGTGFHGYMEIYQKYGLRMPADKRHKALPKIKMFRDIVLAFPWNNLKVHCEVLVTDVANNICGLFDRGVEQEDTAIRIEDYKYNAEWNVKASKHKNLMFPDLPSTKLSGYLVQLSIYADMLERSGMKVADTVVAHIWDGEWHHEEMGRIHGIIDIINKRK